MADVFISYERSAEATARRVADALTSAGHAPWFDALLPAYRDYSEVIEERLGASDVVLVLWSEAAHRSQWVRAEADYARQEGKLVQASLDESLPPMPFNRIQCANLVGWKGGAKHLEWVKVLEGVDQLAGGSALATREAPARPIAMTRAPGRGWRLAVAVIAMVLIVLAGGVWLARGLLHPVAAPGPTRIAILPFDTLSSGQDVKNLADGLTDQILTTLSDNHFQVVSHDDAVTLRGADRDKRLAELGVALLFDGTVQSDGKTLSATVHLEDPLKHVTLWSGHLEAPADQGPQLQSQLATTVVGVLACSNRALAPVHGLSDPALLTRYLRACDIFANHNDGTSPEDTDEMLTDLRQVTAGAPDFAAAHSDLAKFDAYLAPLMPADQAAAARAEAAVEASRALALDPNSPDAYLAREMLAPANHWAEREALLRQGIAVSPDWPHTNGFLGLLLAAVGRLKEATELTHKAASVDLQLDWRPEAAALAGISGQADVCIDPMTIALKLDPKDSDARGALFQCLGYARRWDDMVAFLSGVSYHLNDTDKAFFRAVKTRAPADLAKARNLLAVSPGDSDQVVINKIQSLSLLGFVDDAFAASDRHVMAPGTQPGFLFLPDAEPMRRDPRFMKLAARFGLVDYWRASGHWPDFCSEPGLPYDCKAEAAKLTGKT